jgi:hypothetical protein
MHVAQRFLTHLGRRGHHHRRLGEAVEIALRPHLIDRAGDQLQRRVFVGGAAAVGQRDPAREVELLQQRGFGAQLGRHLAQRKAGQAGFEGHPTALLDQRQFVVINRDRGAFVRRRTRNQLVDRFRRESRSGQPRGRKNQGEHGRGHGRSPVRGGGLGSSA